MRVWSLGLSLDRIAAATTAVNKSLIVLEPQAPSLDKPIREGNAVSEENECLYRCVRGKRSGAWNNMWRGTHCDQQQPGLGLHKGLWRAGVLMPRQANDQSGRAHKVSGRGLKSDRGVEVQYGASHWRHKRLLLKFEFQNSTV